MTQPAEEAHWSQRLPDWMGWTPRERAAPRTDQALLRESVSATRGLVVAEALLLIVLGFTADDLQLLRVPGFLLALAGVVLVLAAGGLVHGHRLKGRLEDLDPDHAQDRLRSARARSRLYAVAATLVFLAWLVLFSLGVPPWAL